MAEIIVDGQSVVVCNTGQSEIVGAPQNKKARVVRAVRTKNE